MKNEDRIVELLSESLQKQDRLTEQVGQLHSAMTDLSKIAGSQLKVQESFLSELRNVRDDIKADIRDLSIQASKQNDLQRQINDITERLDRIEHS